MGEMLTIAGAILASGAAVMDGQMIALIGGTIILFSAVIGFIFREN